LQLHELLLRALHALRRLQEPARDVYHLEIERDHGAIRVDGRREHLAHAERLGRLDLGEAPLLAQEVDLLAGIYPEPVELAEDRVEPVAGELAHPGRDVGATAAHLHHADHEGLRGL